MRIIDSHAHLHLAAGAAETLLATMDRNGIARAVVVAGGTISPELLSVHFARGGGVDFDVDNAGILARCQATSGRLLPFYFANPHRGDAAYRREGAAFRGLKLAPIVHGVAFADPRIDRLLEAAVVFGHPVYLHCLPRAGFEVIDVAQLAQRHPRCAIILGHGGVGHGDFQGIAQIVDTPNVSFEVSGTFTAAARVALKKLGSRRVLFGSEYPLQDPSVELLKMTCLGATEEELAHMLHDNIAALLGEAVAPQADAVVRAQQPSRAPTPHTLH